MTINSIPRLEKVYWGCFFYLDFTLGALEFVPSRVSGIVQLLWDFQMSRQRVQMQMQMQLQQNKKYYQLQMQLQFTLHDLIMFSTFSKFRVRTHLVKIKEQFVIFLASSKVRCQYSEGFYFNPITYGGRILSPPSLLEFEIFSKFSLITIP